MAFRPLSKLISLSARSIRSTNLTNNLIRCSSSSTPSTAVGPFANTLPKGYPADGPEFTPNPGLGITPHGVEETDEEFDRRFEGYFNDKNIDGWILRKRLTELHREDLVPEPKIIAAALRACRRVNDYALAVRYLEALYFKCGNNQKEIWPYLMSELKPTLDELGISTLEELGYDKPELATESPYSS